jgi:hypothetical protein
MTICSGVAARLRRLMGLSYTLRHDGLVAILP